MAPIQRQTALVQETFATPFLTSGRATQKMASSTTKVSNMEPKAVYVHVPFCRHRCGYCDFTLVAGRDDLIERYLAALEAQLRGVERVQAVETIFIGGGTPSHLSPAQISRLLGMIQERFPLEAGGEFSVEANPLDITPERVEVLAQGGVNRISLGVQSFDSEILKLLERDHSRADVVRVVELLQKSIENVSLDLIFGVPGQGLELWERTLEEAIGLRPAHVSTYGLTFEKGTSFWQRREKGALRSVPEELEREMYAAAMTRLPAAGFGQYELSNFAMPGRECRHNQMYWRGVPYYAFGPGGAQYLEGTRSVNHRSVTTWLGRIEEGESPMMEGETLPAEERARELIFLGLRRISGIERDEFRRQSGFDLDQLVGDAIRVNVRKGWLEDDGGRIRLSWEGRFVADSVISEFL